MGNKLEAEKQNSNFSTPTKVNKSQNDLMNKSADLSLRKSGLYSEEKLFENFESKNFFNKLNLIL